MSQSKKNTLVQYVVVALGLAGLMVCQFILHRMTPFIKDDLWYMTRLTSEEHISSFGQIIEAQIWHYNNWGGRVINHALLQAVIASGELGADIFNTLTTLLLGLVICLIANTKNPVMYLLTESAIVAFNASIHYSMYWESGSVNYLYSTVWILFYLYVVIRAVKPECKKLRGVEIWILPLALIAGWSTENMGPACFAVTALVILYKIIKKEKLQVFLFEGAALSAIGSALLILAPGNFVRDQFSDHTGLGSMIYNRLIRFWNASSNYLLPTLIIAIGVLLYEVYVCGKKLSVYNQMLLLYAFIAHFAMLLSPAYPQRTSFGIMAVLIAFIVNVLNEHISEDRPRKVIFFLTASVYIASMLVVIGDMVYSTVGLM